MKLVGTLILNDGGLTFAMLWLRVLYFLREGTYGWITRKPSRFFSGQVIDTVQAEYLRLEQLQ